MLLTGVGKRYDIVSAFAQHAFTIAADPSPLAPAQYAADLRVAPPRIDDPGYVPFLLELCAEHNVGAVVPLTDLDLEVLASARPELPAFVPDAAIAPGIRASSADRTSPLQSAARPMSGGESRSPKRWVAKIDSAMPWARSSRGTLPNSAELSGALEKKKRRRKLGQALRLVKRFEKQVRSPGALKVHAEDQRARMLNEAEDIELILVGLRA